MVNPNPRAERWQELHPHVRHLLDVKHVDQSSLHVHIVSPVDLADGCVEVCVLGGRLKVEATFHHDDFKFVKDFDVSIELLSDAILVESVEVEKHVGVVLIAGDIGLVTEEESREYRSHVSPQHSSF